MDFLKELFGEEALTFEQLSSKVSERGFKVADLSTGNYVGKKKYEDEVSTLNTTISDLNGQIKTRDTDLADLKKKIEDSGKDDATKIADLTSQLSTLQGEYETTKKDYEAKLSKQAYEFAVTEFVNGLEFTSGAAKREFKGQLLGANLKMKNNTIIGVTDFMDAYKAENEDAFKVNTPDPEPQPDGDGKKPMFVKPTGQKTPQDENEFVSAFNFAGVPIN